MKPPTRANRQALTGLPPGWVLFTWVLAMLLLAATTLWLYRNQQAALQQRFDAEVDRITNDLQRRFELPVYGLMGARGLFAASENVSYLEFKRYAESRRLAEEFPGVRGVGFIERVPHKQRAAFEKAVKADAAPNFKVKFLAADPNLLDDHYIIKFIEPLERNRQARGLDIGSESKRRLAANEAMRSGRSTLSRTIHLVQDNQSRPGFLVFAPVYRQDLPTDTPPQREKALVGWTYSPIVLEELLEPAKELLLRSGLNVRVIDPEASAESRILLNIGAPPDAPMFKRDVPLGALNSPLKLEFQSLPPYESRLNLGLVYGLGAAGGLVITLLASVFWLLAHGRSRAVALASQLTQDLEKLALVVKKTTNAVITTGPDLRITWVNDGFVRISGYTLEEAMGKTPSELLSSGKAPLEVLETLRRCAEHGEGCRVEILNRAKDGHEYWIDTEIQPTHDAAGQLTGFIEIGLDITQDRLNNERLVGALLKADEKQLALKASEARSKTLSELSAQWFWETDEEHRFTAFTCGDPQRKADLENVGLGKRRWELGAEPMNTTWQAHQSVLERREVFKDFLYRRIDADGGYRYWSVSGAPWYNEQGQFAGYIGTGTDITKVKRDELRIAESEALLERTGTLAKVGAWQLHLGTGKVSWSAQTCRIHEVPVGHQPTLDEALNHYPPEARIQVVEAIESAMQKGTGWDFEAPLITATGRQIWIKAIGEVETFEGRAVALLGGIQDITEQKAQADALLEAKGQAELASQFKSQFLANMSHEIRTPMNAILGMLNLLNSTHMQPRQVDYVQKAEGAAKSLLGLLNDILDFSKVEAGKLELDLQPFSLDQMLRDIAVIFSTYAAGKPVEVLFDVAPGIPRRVVGDALRLQQILINLGSNAIKFTPQGNVVLKVVVAALTETGTGPVAELRFSVQDNGIGIAPENQDKIFAGFTQAEASTTRRFGGTGLGLAISRHLIGMMGGQLTLQSALGQGSTFSFNLPLQVAEASAQLTLPEPTRVLFVDDNLLALELAASMGRTLGWQVDTAPGGAAALALIEKQLHTPGDFQALFIDCEMPGVDGWELASRIRSLYRSEVPHTSSENKGPVIVMVTANGREALVRQTPEVQSLIDSYLVKPVTASMLLDALQLAVLPQNSQTRAPQLSGQVSRPLAGLRILVVEDNAINQQVAEELISGQGARVDIADNGRRGIEALEASIRDGKPYHAILMDMQMPVMDGISATRHIREDMGETNIPIIAMTANAMSSDRDLCLQAGMNDHIGKPFDLGRLVATLLSWTKGGLAAPPEPAAAPGTDVGTGADFTGQRTTDSCESSPVLHWEAALLRIGGSESLLKRMCTQFLQEAPLLLDNCTTAITLGNVVPAQKTLHTLRGVAATLGADRLVCVVRQGENQLKAGQPFNGAQLQEVYQLTVQALSTHGVVDPDHPTPASTLAGAANTNSPPLAPAEREALVKLLEWVQAADTTAFDALATLKGLAPQAHPRWQALEEALEALDFEQAAVCINQALGNSSAAS